MTRDFFNDYMAAQPPKLRDKTVKYNLMGFHRGQRIVDLIRPKPGARVLDIGSGTGGIAAAFAEAGCHVLAIEPHPLLFAITTDRLRPYPNCNAWNQKFTSAIYTVGNNFDVVILNDVMEHTPKQTFDYAVASLAPQGQMWVSTPNRLSPKQILKEGHSGLFGVGILPPRIARPYVERIRKAMPHYDITHLYTYRELVHLFHFHGLEYEMIDEFKPARHFPLAPQFLKNLVAHDLRPGFFEFIARRPA